MTYDERGTETNKKEKTERQKIYRQLNIQKNIQTNKTPENEMQMILLWYSFHLMWGGLVRVLSK